jgi:hypothetical protein
MGTDGGSRGTKLGHTLSSVCSLSVGKGKGVSAVEKGYLMRRLSTPAEACDRWWSKLVLPTANYLMAVNGTVDHRTIRCACSRRLPRLG